MFHTEGWSRIGNATIEVASGGSSWLPTEDDALVLQAHFRLSASGRNALSGCDQISDNPDIPLAHSTGSLDCRPFDLPHNHPHPSHHRVQLHEQKNQGKGSVAALKR